MKAITTKGVDAELSAYMESVRDIEKFSEAPVVKTNPFLSKLPSMEIKYKTKAAINGVGSVDIVNQETGEVTSGVGENRVFTKREQVDNNAFMKIYMKRYKEIYKLSLSAIKVFGYILEEMQRPEHINKHMIYFDIKECMEFGEYNTTPMVYQGLTELITHGFVARADRPNHLYVDSSAAFNGNRIVIVEEYIRKEADHFDDKSLSE